MHIVMHLPLAYSPDALEAFPLWIADANDPSASANFNSMAKALI